MVRYPSRRRSSDVRVGLHPRGPSQGNIATHAEGHAVAIIWQKGVREAVLSVDRPRCEVCGRNLPSTLPPRAHLLVVSRDEGGDSRLGLTRSVAWLASPPNAEGAEQGVGLAIGALAIACETRKCVLYVFLLPKSNRGPCQAPGEEKGRKLGSLESFCTQPETASDWFYLENRP